MALSESAGKKLDHSIEQAIPDIAATLLQVTGQNFPHNKPGTLGRCVHRRLHDLNIPTFAEYVERLRSDNDQTQTLFRELQIEESERELASIREDMNRCIECAATITSAAK